MSHVTENTGNIGRATDERHQQPRALFVGILLIVIAGLTASCAAPRSTPTPAPTSTTTPTATDRPATRTPYPTLTPSTTPTATLLPATQRASVGRMPVGIDEADARQVALEMVAGGSEPRVEWIRLVSGRQWNLIQRPANEAMAQCRCCPFSPDLPNSLAVYVVEVSAGEARSNDSEQPTSRVRRRVAIDANAGAVLYMAGPGEPMGANLLNTDPPVPIAPPPPGQLATRQALATATMPAAAVEGGWSTMSGTYVPPDTVEHNAKLTDVTAAVPFRQGVRWIYQYVEDPWLPPRAVTHTVALVQEVGPEQAVVRIATTGGPGFIPEWLLIDHGNLFAATAAQASAWLRGNAARPTLTVPYAMLPPSDSPVSWQDGGGLLTLSPYTLARGVGRVPPKSAQYRGCSLLSYYAWPGRFTDEVICPGIGWVQRSAGAVCAQESWTLSDFDPGPGADPSVRATAAWVLATATPVGGRR